MKLDLNDVAAHWKPFAWLLVNSFLFFLSFFFIILLFSFRASFPYSFQSLARRQQVVAAATVSLQRFISEFTSVSGKNKFVRLD